MPFPYNFPFYFDDIQTSLLDHQTDHSFRPYIKLELTKSGEDSYNICAGGKLISLDYYESLYSDEAQIILDNRGQYFTDVDLRGYKVVFKLGLQLQGNNYYITLAPRWVIDMGFESQPGVMRCVLNCEGFISKMSHDKASKEYNGSGTAKQIADGILKATLAPFNHCEPVDVVWHGDSGLDGINIYAPSDYFSISLNDNRLSSLRKLIDMSNSFMRTEEDEKVHLRIPVTSGNEYDYTFSLDGHQFFSHKLNKNILIPNRVVVTSENEIIAASGKVTPVTYTGSANDSESYALMPKSYYVDVPGLSGNDEASNLAESILKNFQQGNPKGSLEVPVDYYLKLGDYIQVEDKRLAYTETYNYETLLSNTTEIDSAWDIWDRFWFGNSFEFDETKPFNAFKFRGSRQGTPGTLYISVYEAVDHIPTGEALVTGEYDGNILPVDAEDGPEWFTIQLSGNVSGEVGKQYVFVVSCPTGDAWNRVFMYDNEEYDSIPGCEIISEDSGETWETDEGWDFNMEVMNGTPVMVGDKSSSNVSAIQWHYSKGKYRQYITKGGLSNLRRTNFVQDYVPKSDRFYFPFWHTASLPSTFLRPGQWINFHNLIVPHYRTFYIGSYSINSNDQGGTLMVLVWSEDSEDWVELPSFPFKSADTQDYDTVYDVYDSYDEGGTPIAFIVYNGGEEAISGITAHVSYDCQYQPGGLP